TIDCGLALVLQGIAVVLLAWERQGPCSNAWISDCWARQRAWIGHLCRIVSRHHEPQESSDRAVDADIEWLTWLPELLGGAERVAAIIVLKRDAVTRHLVWTTGAQVSSGKGCNSPETSSKEQQDGDDDGHDTCMRVCS